MNSLSHKPLADGVIGAYVSWREACLRVTASVSVADYAFRDSRTAHRCDCRRSPTEGAT